MNILSGAAEVASLWGRFQQVSFFNKRDWHLCWWRAGGYRTYI